MTMQISIVVDATKSKCPDCHTMQYASDIMQFGRCKSCAEKILGERIILIRDIVGIEPDEDEWNDPDTRLEAHCPPRDNGEGRANA